MDKYLRETEMLDYSNPIIQNLIQKKQWKKLDEFERIKEIYNFVRDDILFGYNEDDAICASKVRWRAADEYIGEQEVYVSI